RIPAWEEGSAAGTAGAQGGQLPEYHFFQFTVGAGDGDAGAAGNLEFGCAGARDRGWRPRAGVQRERRYSSAGASGWKSAGRSRLGHAELGEDDARLPEYQQLNLRKTYRHGQLRHVLFRLGGGRENCWLVSVVSNQVQRSEAHTRRKIQSGRRIRIESRFGRFPSLYRIIAVFLHPRG